jgi:hypothetical protein
MHDNCGHPVESITPEKQERIAVLEDEMRFLNKARDSYLSQALNHGITIIKLKEDMKELEAALQKETEAALNQHDLWLKEKDRTLELAAELVKAGSDIAGFSNLLLESQVACQKRGAELAKAKDAAQRTFHEVEQTLGKALGYPWFKDDRANFPDATEADGVCVGEHVPESIALEVANKIKELEAELTNWKDMGTIAHTTALNHYDLLRKADADNVQLRNVLKSSWRLIPDPTEGEPVVYVGVHAVRWQPEWGNPTVAFIQNEP